MSLVVIGASHRSAPLWFLEALAQDDAGADKLADALVGGSHISEAVVLSTCNRTELYLAAETFHGAFGEARDALTAVTFLGAEHLAEHITVLHDDDAVQHLFDVAAGLDSVVVGEHEILGQVRSAWLTASRRRTSGPRLALAFRHAIEAGKRVRSETAISRSSASIPHAAVDLAATAFGGSMRGRDAVVVGAGEMGVAAARALAGRGATVTLVNRTPDRAARAAQPLGLAWDSLANLDVAMRSADVVVTATAANSPVISADEVVSALSGRLSDDPLVIVDIAMPRNVDPSVRQLAGVRLCDMDDLGAHVETGLASRRLEIPRVRTIIGAEVERYRLASGSRAVAPLVTDLHRSLSAIRDAELERFSHRVAALDPESRATLDAVVSGIVGKVLHEPTSAVKAAAGTPRGDRLAAALRELFGL